MLRASLRVICKQRVRSARFFSHRARTRLWAPSSNWITIGFMAVAPAFPLPLLGGRPCRRLLVFLQAAVFVERGGGEPAGSGFRCGIFGKFRSVPSAAFSVNRFCFLFFLYVPPPSKLPPNMTVR